MEFLIGFASPHRQPQASLPLDAIKHLLKNCTSVDLIQKLSKCCKYFFNNLKIAMIDGWIIFDANAKLSAIRDNHHMEPNTIVSLTLNQSFKYWLIDRLSIASNHFNFDVFHKTVYRCNLEALKICGGNFSFNEICFLIHGGNIECLHLWKVNMRHEEDQSSVNMDAILQQCPNISELRYLNLPESFSTTTFQNLSEIQTFHNIDKLDLIIQQIDIHGIDAFHFSEFFRNSINFNANAKILFNCNFQGFDAFRGNVQNHIGDLWTNLKINLS